MKIQTKIRFLLCIFCFSILLFSALTSVYAENAEEENNDIYKVSYGKGIYISYQGSEPKNFIKGTPPTSQKVNKNGSVVVSDNTFTFRDYSFGGWKYTYTDGNGDKKTKYYSPGDVIENINCNMKLEATWSKKKESLKVGSFLLYADTNDKTEHFIGEIILLKNAPTPPQKNYSFCGWTDNEGTVLYPAGESYEIKNINTVIKPVWSVNGEKINYRKISVTTKGCGSASLSQIFILSGTSQNIEFFPDEGYALASVTVNGNKAKTSNSLSIKAENDDIYIEAIFDKISSITETSSDPEESTDLQDSEEYQIEVTIDGEGDVSPDDTIVVKKGDSLSLTFTPHKDYQLPAEITDNGEEVFFNNKWDGVYTIDNIQQNHQIKVCFVNKNSGDTSSVENSNPVGNDSEKSSSNFTKTVCVVIIIIAVIFGVISISYTKNKSQKSTHKNKNSSTKKKRK